jgi:hypothetical protein
MKVLKYELKLKAVLATGSAEALKEISEQAFAVAEMARNGGGSSKLWKTFKEAVDKIEGLQAVIDEAPHPEVTFHGKYYRLSHLAQEEMGNKVKST